MLSLMMGSLGVITMKWKKLTSDVADLQGNTYSEAADVLKHGGAHRTQSQAHTSSLLVFSKMSFALFVCTNKLLCNVYSVQCVRNRLMTMQEEAVV